MVNFIQAYTLLYAFLVAKENAETNTAAARLRLRGLTTEAGKVFKKFRAVSIEHPTVTDMNAISELIGIENPEVTLHNLQNPVVVEKPVLTPEEIKAAKIARLQASLATLLAD